MQTFTDPGKDLNERHCWGDIPGVVGDDQYNLDIFEMGLKVADCFLTMSTLPEVIWWLQAPDRNNIRARRQADAAIVNRVWAGLSTLAPSATTGTPTAHTPASPVSSSTTPTRRSGSGMARLSNIAMSG